MIEFIFEMIFDLILEGAIEASGDKKVPRPLRITAAVLIIVVYGGFIAFLTYIGVRDRNWLLIILAVIILGFTGYGMINVYKKHRKK